MENSFLIDTNIIIDALHHNAKAVAFIEKFEVVNISVITFVELIYGCSNKEELRDMHNLLVTYNIEHVNEDVSLIASQLVSDLFLKLGVLMDDAIIAGTCLYKGYTLATRDKKRFMGIRGLKVLSPY